MPVINEIETGFRIGSDGDFQTLLSECVREEFEAARIVGNNYKKIRDGLGGRTLPPQYKKIILPAVEETDEVDELLLMDEDETESDETGVEVFEDDHGLESEEGEEAESEVEEGGEEPFEEI